MNKADLSSTLFLPYFGWSLNCHWFSIDSTAILTKKPSPWLSSLLSLNPQLPYSLHLIMKGCRFLLHWVSSCLNILYFSLPIHFIFSYQSNVYVTFFLSTSQLHCYYLNQMQDALRTFPSDPASSECFFKKIPLPNSHPTFLIRVLNFFLICSGMSI